MSSPLGMELNSQLRRTQEEPVISTIWAATLVKRTFSRWMLVSMARTVAFEEEAYSMREWTMRWDLRVEPTLSRRMRSHVPEAAERVKVMGSAAVPSARSWPLTMRPVPEAKRTVTPGSMMRMLLAGTVKLAENE